MKVSKEDDCTMCENKRNMTPAEEGSAGRAAVESAYCIFHQKWRVYQYSTSPSQRDDIEYAVASYAMEMSPELYRFLADGRDGFLLEHTRFAADMTDALAGLERMLDGTDGRNERITASKI